MLKNYFTIAWRNITRTKMYSVINIVGLAIGMAVSILIGLWVFDELSYNQSFKNYDRLAQVHHHITFGEEIITIMDIPAPFGEVLKSYDDFEDVCITSWPSEHILNFNQTKFSEQVMFVEPKFGQMFSVNLVEGTFFSTDVHSILISQSTAKKLIGDDAVGKVIKFDNLDPLTVVGVYADFPRNSYLADVKTLLPMAYKYAKEPNLQNEFGWGNYLFQCFVLLKEKTSLKETDAKVKNLLFEKSTDDGKALKPKGLLLPMAKWHLYSEFKNGVSAGGPIRFVIMIGTIGIFVLLLACINFMNLSTARSEKRSKEVGIRKVMGSLRAQLVFQFLSESFLMVIFGYLSGCAIAALSLPWFNDLAGKTLTIPWTNSIFILASLAFIIVTSTLAGSYPAMYLSGFNPVKVLKGTFKTGRFASLPRKAMVVMQFTTSIILIIGTAIVFQQIQHAKERPVGFDREGIIHLPIHTEGLTKADYNSLRHELLATGAVENMATSDFPVTGPMSAEASLAWEGKDPASAPLIALNSCSHDFPKTNGFQFVEGRDFSRDFVTDSTAMVVNEMAAKLISKNSVLGMKVTFTSGRQREIVGVIKDQVRWTPFVNQSPHFYYVNYSIRRFLTIRLNPQIGTHEALEKIEAIVKKFDAEAPFEYKFQDDDYARQFNDTERIGKLAGVFSSLAIFISCIGIFGLATFTASQRTKEIGIRKVLGASIFNVWTMISNDFVKLVLVAIALGAPSAYYFANEWLQQYDYRIEISWMVFVSTGLLAIFITLLTVSYQALKAAYMNPVNSLRNE